MSDKKVYYSGSLAGATELDIHLPLQIVDYIKSKGTIILDPHVALPFRDETYFTTIAKVHGFTFEEWNGLKQHEKDIRIYRHDIELVDEATHVIALLNGVSHGVGMEIQEALRKPDIGLNITPILGLIHESLIDKLSPMIRGASKLHKEFKLRPYSRLDDIKKAIDVFLDK